MITPEDDIQAATAPAIVRAAGGIVLGAGVLAVLVAVQTLTGFWVRSDFQIGLTALAALGVANGVIGLMLMRARAWAATAAVVGAGAQLLGASTWLLISLRGGLVSLFALSAPPITLGAVVLAVLAIGPCRRAAAARARLVAQGLDMGT